MEANRAHDRSSIVPPFRLHRIIAVATRELRENPSNERIIFRPLSPPPYTPKTCIRIGEQWLRKAEQRAMLPNFQQRSWTISRSQSRGAKFRVSRRFGGGEGLAGFHGAQNGTTRGKNEAVQVAGMKRVSKAWGTLVERSTKIQAESGGTLVSIFRNHRGKGNVESSICSMIFHPRLYPRKLRRMNYVVQVLLVKFRSKYQSSFEFLGSLCISRWQLVYNSVIIIQWKLEFICRWRW